MPYYTKLLTLFTITLLPISTSAQSCKTNSIPASTPTNRFTINKNGTVSDLKTGLTWKKCSEGQNGINCGGAATFYTWQDAIQQAQNVNNKGGFAGYKDWRLPSDEELRSIVEYQCTDPSINLIVFPKTPINGYWSSSPYVRALAWGVSFREGHVFDDYMLDSYFVRLVR